LIFSVNRRRLECPENGWFQAAFPMTSRGNGIFRHIHVRFVSAFVPRMKPSNKNIIRSKRTEDFILPGKPRSGGWRRRAVPQYRKLSTPPRPSTILATILGGITNAVEPFDLAFSAGHLQPTVLESLGDGLGKSTDRFEQPDDGQIKLLQQVHKRGDRAFVNVQFNSAPGKHPNPPGIFSKTASSLESNYGSAWQCRQVNMFMRSL
jgi:hypothetical protein